MIREELSVSSSEDAVLHVSRWIPREKEIKSVLIINHGMAEHIRRYDRFAAFLCRRGIAVYGEDHRGHGLTARDDADLGYLADEKGWSRVIDDIRALHLRVKEECPGVPVMMMGHSMGSFLTRHYLSLYGEELACSVISGTGYTPRLTSFAGSLIARREIKRRGGRHRSTLLDNMSFGRFNRPFEKEGETGFEWLSRDRAEVEKYHKDPLCGFICTAGFFRDLFDGLRVINNPRTFWRTPDELPLLLIAGDQDPVGDRGKGVRKVFRLFNKTGSRDVTLRLIPGARHECLNEINKDEIYSEITDWMEKKVMSQAH